MTAVLPRTTGRHAAPESADDVRWASPAEFRAAWTRVGRHAAVEYAGQPDPFDWLGTAPAAG